MGRCAREIDGILDALVGGPNAGGKRLADLKKNGRGQFRGFAPQPVKSFGGDLQ